MNPIPNLTLQDYTILRELIKNNTDTRIANEVNQLANELDRAVVNKTEPVPSDVIQINSFVEVEEEVTKSRLKIKIVLPQEANLKEGKISVFAPLSIALIGFKTNDKVVWEMPSGIKNITITQVSS